MSSYYEVLDTSHQPWGYELLLGEPRSAPGSDSKARLYKELIERGCKPLMRETEGGLVLRLIMEERRGSALAKGAILALVTVAMVYLSGEWLAGAPGPRGEGFSWSPWGYLTGLLVPLLVHELGHWSIMKLYRVPSSIPYLIPAPPLQLGFLGTLGAVINLRWLPPTPGSLALMAVMGPLAGFIAAIPFTIAGMKASILAAPTDIPGGAAQLQLAPAFFLILADLYAPKGDGPILLSPLAYASYIVLLVTFLNLMPVAMLDGGHIVRSAVSEGTHRVVSQATIMILLVLSTVYPAFFMFALLAMIIYFLSKGRHPGPAMGEAGLGRVGVVSIILYGILLALTAPIPIG